MSLCVVVGGQYGSEGKGKATAHIAWRDDVEIVVRCGGPNSGHTVDHQGRRYELRCLPAGFINRRTRLLLGSGCVLNPSLLFTEMKTAGVEPGRVGIDPNAGIISPLETDEEMRLGLGERIGSTLSGTGMAVAKRVLRTPGFLLARDIPELRSLLTDVSSEVNQALDCGARVVVEGTQGFGLSVYHSPHYPFATSRDTTASGFLSEVGVSPRLVSDIVMCVRTYPIRVGGNSGPLKNEVTWKEVQNRSGYPTPIEEYTTTTKRLRRVALFDEDLVARAAAVNRPTQIALHGSDYLSFLNRSVRSFCELDSTAREFIDRLEGMLGVGVTLVGTGPTGEDIIDRTPA